MRARVEADEIAGRDAEVLQVHRVAAGDRQAPGLAQRNGALVLAPHRDDQLEPFEAVIVVGPCLECHFFERRDAPIARRAHDAHIGRAVVEAADVVLGVAGVVEAVGVAQPDPVRRVGCHGKRADQLLAVGRQRHLRPVLEHQRRRGDRRRGGAGRHAQRHARAVRGVDVAAVGLGARGQARVLGIRVRQVDLRDAGRLEQRHLELTGPVARHRHVVGERARQALEAEREAALGVRLHAGRARGILHPDGQLGYQAAGVLRRRGVHDKRGVGPDAGVARRDVEHQPRRKRPQPDGAGGLAHRLAPQEGQRQQRRHGRRGAPRGAAHARRGDHQVDVVVAHPAGRVVEQERGNRRGRVALDDVDGRHQPVLEPAQVVLGQPGQADPGSRAGLAAPGDGSPGDRSGQRGGHHQDRRPGRQPGGRVPDDEGGDPQ